MGDLVDPPVFAVAIGVVFMALARRVNCQCGYLIETRYGTNV